MYTYLSDLKKPLKEQLEACIANQKTRYPASMGLTGACLAARTLLSTNAVEQDHRFDDDVDNVLKVKPLRHMLVSEVSAWDVDTSG